MWYACQEVDSYTIYIVGNYKKKNYLFMLYKQDEKQRSPSFSPVSQRVQINLNFPTMYIYTFILQFTLDTLETLVVKMKIIVSNFSKKSTQFKRGPRRGHQNKLLRKKKYLHYRLLNINAGKRKLQLTSNIIISFLIEHFCICKFPSIYWELFGTII